MEAGRWYLQDELGAQRQTLEVLVRIGAIAEDDRDYSDAIVDRAEGKRDCWPNRREMVRYMKI